MLDAGCLEISIGGCKLDPWISESGCWELGVGCWASFAGLMATRLRVLHIEYWAKKLSCCALALMNVKRLCKRSGNWMLAATARPHAA